MIYSLGLIYIADGLPYFCAERLPRDRSRTAVRMWEREGRAERRGGTGGATRRQGRRHVGSGGLVRAATAERSGEAGGMVRRRGCC